MKFILRDDDTCAFTTIRELELCYGHIWEKIPVNLSVTPFRIPGEAPSVPKEYMGVDKILPLEQNKELVMFLRRMIKTGKINIALHGYNHTKPNNLPEYVGENNLKQKTRDGKLYLEKLLACTIDTFVPPNNGIAREGLNAIIANDLNLIGLPSLVRPFYRQIKIKNILKYLTIKFFQMRHNVSYPFVVTVDGHKEITYCSVTPSQNLNQIITRLNNCYNHDGVFIFSTHYHAFEKKLQSGEYIKDVLDSILYITSKFDNVEYCTYKRLWGLQ